jgi:dihydrofolate reductase
MRRVIFQNMISLDGYFEGPGREIDWHNVDNEFNEIAIKFLNSVDLLIFGRVTYELMVAYWPSEAALTDDPVIAGLMNKMAKIVFSRSLEKVGWKNTRMIRDNIVYEVIRLKMEPGKDIAIFGSSDLALALIPANLIDEYRIIVNPIFLGKGKSLLQGLDTRLKLELMNAESFQSGNVLLRYEIQKK